MSQFTLSIKLGNESMQTGSDIAESLRTIADKIQDNGNMIDFSGSKRIVDLNGNVVGIWSVQ